MFREILQNSQKNTCAKASFLIKLQTSIKKRLWHRCFPGNFTKFLRTPFLQNTSGWLFLMLVAFKIKFSKQSKITFLLRYLSLIFLTSQQLFFFIFNTLKVNKSVHIASRAYRFCWQYAVILVRKTWSSLLNRLNR